MANQRYRYCGEESYARREIRRQKESSVRRLQWKAAQQNERQKDKGNVRCLFAPPIKLTGKPSTSERIIAEQLGDYAEAELRIAEGKMVGTFWSRSTLNKNINSRSLSSIPVQMPDQCQTGKPEKIAGHSKNDAGNNKVSTQNRSTAAISSLVCTIDLSRLTAFKDGLERPKSATSDSRLHKDKKQRRQ